MIYKKNLKNKYHYYGWFSGIVREPPGMRREVESRYGWTRPARSFMSPPPEWGARIAKEVGFGRTRPNSKPYGRFARAIKTLCAWGILVFFGVVTLRSRYDI